MDQDVSRQLARLMVMESLFEHEGWRELVTELEGEVEVIKRQLLAATSWDVVKFLQGKSEHCFQMIYLPDTISNMKDQLLGETDAAV